MALSERLSRLGEDACPTEPSPELAGLPDARPEDIGLSLSGLDRLIASMEREIAAARRRALSMAIARAASSRYRRAPGHAEARWPEMPLTPSFASIP